MQEKKTQQLDRRNTPTDVVPVCSNCGLSLKAPRDKGGVADVQTLSNSPEEHLTDLGMSDVLSRLARDKLPATLRGVIPLLTEVRSPLAQI